MSIIELNTRVKKKHFYWGARVMNRRYFWTCGHESEFIELVDSPRKQRLRNAICAECQAGVVKRIDIICEVCGEVVASCGRHNRVPSVLRFCNSCREKRIEARNIKYNALRRGAVENLIAQEEPRNSDCSYYLSKCLPIMAKNGKNLCYNCSEYKKEDLESHNFMFCRDTFTVTNFGAEPLRDY